MSRPAPFIRSQCGRAVANSRRALHRGGPRTVSIVRTSAQRIYPDRKLRTFTDIDLLISPSATPEVAALLTAGGYDLVNEEGACERRGWKWEKRENPSLMIEVHTDLVHAPTLRAGWS